MPPRWCTRRDGACELELRLTPRASRDGVQEASAERLRIRISAPAVDGAANRALVRWLARAFGVAPSKVSVLSGQRAREKRVRIESPQRTPEWLSDDER